MHTGGILSNAFSSGPCIKWLIPLNDTQECFEVDYNRFIGMKTLLHCTLPPWTVSWTWHRTVGLTASDSVQRWNCIGPDRISFRLYRVHVLFLGYFPAVEKLLSDKMRLPLKELAVTNIHVTCSRRCIRVALDRQTSMNDRMNNL